MMKKHWERTRGKLTEYAQISARGFTIGEHRGSGHTDSAGSCSLEELLNGRFQDEVVKTFGRRALVEVIAAAKVLLADTSKKGKPPPSPPARVTKTKGWTAVDDRILIQGARNSTLLLGHLPVCDDEGTPIEDAHSYYLLDLAGEVVRAFEGGTSHVKDEAFIWCHQVVRDQQLVKYVTVTQPSQPAIHRPSIELSGLFLLPSDSPRLADAHRSLKAHLEGKKRNVSRPA